MNPEQRLKLCIVQNAAYYGQELSDDQVRLYAADMKDLDPDLVEKAYCILRLDASRTTPGFAPRLPLPVEIRNRLRAIPGDEALGVDAATRIWSMIGTAGEDLESYCRYKNEPYPEGVIKRIGQLGWAVIQQWGGWSKVVRESHDAESGVMRAQLRETGKLIVERVRREGPQVLVAIASRKDRPPELTKISDFLAALPSPVTRQLNEPENRVKEARTDERNRKP